MGLWRRRACGDPRGHLWEHGARGDLRGAGLHWPRSLQAGVPGKLANKLGDICGEAEPATIFEAVMSLQLDYGPLAAAQQLCESTACVDVVQGAT